MIELTKENFESEVLNYNDVVLVDFWAEGCGPCRMLISILKQLEAELPNVKFCKINIDENMGLADKYNISGVPTLLIFSEGHLRHSIVGLRPKQYIKSLIE